LRRASASAWSASKACSRGGCVMRSRNLRAWGKASHPGPTLLWCCLGRRHRQWPQLPAPRSNATLGPALKVLPDSLDGETAVDETEPGGGGAGRASRMERRVRRWRQAVIEYRRHGLGPTAARQRSRRRRACRSRLLEATGLAMAVRLYSRCREDAITNRCCGTLLSASSNYLHSRKNSESPVTATASLQGARLQTAFYRP